MNTTAETENTLRITRTFNAPRERVFDAWTQPEAIMRWLGCEHSTIKSARIDLRVGGEMRVVMQSEHGDCELVSQYRVIAPPETLRFTWRWSGDEQMEASGETLVTVELTDLGDGRTEMQFTHAGFPTQEFADLHNYGWGGGFDKLARFLES